MLPALHTRLTASSPFREPPPRPPLVPTGKDVPLYRLHYRAGRWPLRLRITPPVHFLARFEFLFEDAVGVSKRRGRG